SAAVDAHAHDLCNCACAADADALRYGLCVLACQGPLGGVVAAALRAEDQETTQARPMLDGPGEAAGAVRHLTRAGNRCPLRHTTCAVTLQVRQVTPPLDG